MEAPDAAEGGRAAGYVALLAPMRGEIAGARLCTVEFEPLWAAAAAAAAQEAAQQHNERSLRARARSGNQLILV